MAELIHSLNKGNNLLVIMPHAGNVVPEEIRSKYIINSEFLNGYDKFSKEIFLPLLNLGANVLYSDVHRHVVDLNRKRDDFSDGGVIKEFANFGYKILKNEYSTSEKQKILKNYYDSFYNTLDSVLLNKFSDENPIFIFIGHTMKKIGPNNIITGIERPVVCYCTNSDTLADLKYNLAFEKILKKKTSDFGLSYGKNTPYNGSNNLTTYYRAKNARNQLFQIEIRQDFCEDVNNLNLIKDIIYDSVNSFLKLMNK